MYALSLLQPWASLVVMGVKTIETRSWSTRHRGPLLIHASLGKAGSIFSEDAPFKKYIGDFNALPFGAIIGKVTLEKILRTEDFELPDAAMNALTLEEKAFGDYGPGRYGWVLIDAVKFKKPIPARGMPGLWNFKNDVSI
ncbi:MAG: ASCH domain-containing protein [Ferruginibacter sp.]